MPLAAPAEPATPPGFIVRAQMAEPRELFLPATADAPAGARVKAETTIPTELTKTGGADAVVRTGGEQPSDDKTFVAPPPRPFFRPFNSVIAPTDDAPCCTHGTVVFETVPGLFDAAGAVPRIYARAEYLSWWTKGFHIPVLATTAPATDPEFTRGALGSGGTAPLFGGNSTSIGPTSGGRFTVGLNLDPCGLCGIEASYFFIARKDDTTTLDSTRFPVLARPFFDVNFGTQDRQLTASPGILPGDEFKLRGTITIRDYSELWGTEINYRRLLCADCNWSISGLAGFRFLDLREGLSITENVVSAQAVPNDTLGIFTPGNQIIVSDQFRTQNQFYGGQLGAEGEYRSGRWSLMGRVQVALGVTHSTVDIAGSQSVTTLAGQTQVFPAGGLLALPSNSGSFSHNQFSVVPQIGLKVGYNVTDNVRLFVGYDFLYWSNVLRPGDQIDTTLNSSQIPNFGAVPPSNVVRPVVPFRTSPFYAHGITAGVEVRY
jgi:hypothetical protein